MRHVTKWAILFLLPVFALSLFGDVAHAVNVASVLDMSAPLMGAAFIGRTMIAPGGRAELAPFTAGTRRRIQTIGQYTMTPGTPIPTITLPQVGFLTKIFLRVEGTITQTAGAATLSPLGYAALFARIRVNANLGSASIVDASAAGIEMSNYWYSPSAGPVKNTYGNAIAANRVKYGLMVPINANDRSLLQLGMINLQAEQIRVTLDVTPAGIGAYIPAGGGTITPALVLHVAYEYWDVPNPQRYQLPPATISRLLEDQIQITTTGEQVYTMPRLGTLAQMTEYFIIAGALGALDTATPDITNFKVRANKTDTLLDYDTKFAEMEEQMFYNTAGGSFMRPGARTWDFFHSGQQERNMGDRDLIDTEQITTLDFVSTVASTVVPGTTSTRNCVRRVFQSLGGY
jgi:hypothetical protein